MQFSIPLSAAILQLATLCSSTPLLTPRASGAACSFIDNIGAISCPGGCCGWSLAGSTTPFCDASSASTLALSNKPANWASSCTTLKSDTTSKNKNYILTEFQQNTWNAIVSNDGCRFEVNISDPEDSSDPIRIAASDIATFMGLGISATQSGNYGAIGSTNCYGYKLQWRVVPPGN